MHALLELLPLIGLIGGYFLGKSIHPDEAMYYLSYGAIIGTLLQFGLHKLLKLRIQKMTLITGLMLIGFAVITIILRNKLFIQLKPTVLSWGFALFFWGYAWLKKQSVLELMMGGQFTLAKEKWLTLNWAWIVFNVLIGAGNLFVVWQISAGHWGEGTWLGYKSALVPISLVFIVGQTMYLLKHGKQKSSQDNSDSLNKQSNKQNNPPKERKES